MAVRLALAFVGVAALRPPSRFASRGGESQRKRVLPIYRPPDDAPPTTQLPVPGSSRKFRLAVETPAQLEMVKDLRKYGAFVRVVCDVVDARAGDGAGAVVATCAGPDARVEIGRVAKIFPYEAAEVQPLADGDGFDEGDALAAYDVVDDADPGVGAARARCVDALRRTLELCEKRDPQLGAVDGMDTPLREGEYARMRARLLEAAAEAAEEENPFLDDAEAAAASEQRDRNLGFRCLALVDAPASVRRQCLLTRSASRRYAAVARHVLPLYKELAAVSALGAPEPLPARPAPTDAPLAFAALRPGRRLRYWWSEEVGWSSGEVVDASGGDDGVDVAVAFDGDDASTKRLPLLSADRGRWKLLPL